MSVGGFLKGEVRCIIFLNLLISYHFYFSFLNELNALAKYELFHILMMTKILLLDSKKLDGSKDISEDLMTSTDLIGPEFYQKLKLILTMFKKRNWLE